jgi:hypothetical protein
MKGDLSFMEMMAKYFRHPLDFLSHKAYAFS